MLAYDSLPDPDDRFELKEVIGTGVCSKVYRAFDKEGNRFVAVKCQRYENEMVHYINEEYRILRDFSSHPNLPSFHGVYRKKFTTAQSDEIWFILELCEGGSVIDIIRSLQTINKRVSEEHLAYILRETAKALLHLHENNVMHRDIRGSNILMTKDGEIKLCDFGLSRDVKSTGGRRSTFIGSPSWMAPEIVACSKIDRKNGYEGRAEVWALGITAIELADGKPPFADMHPTRAMFQILRNPPPTLYRQSNWTQNFNDFIAECLEKNPDHRPFLSEIMEHPFFTELPSNDYHLSQELKFFQKDIESMNFPQQSESLVYEGYIKNHDNKMEKMYVEDLAAIEPLYDDEVLEEIKNKMKIGETYSFIGDILLSMNPNRNYPQYDRKFHGRYQFKSRSDNAPHIFSVADSAYQDMLHHEEQQFIIFSGETYSGKTTNMKLCFDHLVFMGEGNAGIVTRVNNATKIVSTLTNSGTPQNHDSTRCVMQLQMTFGQTGRLSGIVFWIYLLEKLRVSSTDMSQPNFHLFYYFYDTMEAEERLKDFHLEGGRTYRYLRIPETFEKSKLNHVRDDRVGNVIKFKEFEEALMGLDISQECIDSIYRILAAILILGDVRFKESDNDRKAALVDPRIVKFIADLLRVDEKKFQWSLMNYCVIINGNVEKRRHLPDEARDARDVLAGNLYSRLVDYIVNIVNHKLALNRAIFGDTHSIVLVDLFGFECHKRNNIDQIFINSLNEQMQYHFNQRCFVWEMLEQEEEQVPVTKLHFYDNKTAVDHLLSTQKGLFSIFDDASRGRYSYEFITEAVNNRKSPYLQRFSNHEFTVCHYSGKINYDTRDLIEKNRDFLPPEMFETLRVSEDNVVRVCFTNPLSKSGNLTMNMDGTTTTSKGGNKKSAWGAAIMSEKNPIRRMNSLSRGQYSQTHKMRTLSSIFRATSLEILKNLSVVSNSSGVHFVRCIRSDLDYRELGFNEDVVRQQMRALAIVDTARARQKGYSARVSFSEFLRRYKFLAFDFDENVDISKENCRLLLIRLKMEGWVIGNSKVFLKYYNEEFLSRLYETQVKKIIKVQSMMRAFLAKRNIQTKIKEVFGKPTTTKSTAGLMRQPSKAEIATTEKAVVKIQTAFRGYQIRKLYGPLINSKTGKVDMATAKFIEPFATRWRKKSIFQILLQYRSVRHLDLVNFSQQIHIYNQRIVHGTTKTSQCIILDKIDPKETNKEQLGPIRRAVWRMPFRLDEIPFFDTTMMCEPADLTFFTTFDEEFEPWDAPLRRRQNVSSQISSKLNQYPRKDSQYSEIGSDDGVLIMEPFTRDPTMPLKKIRSRRYDSPRPSLQMMEDAYNIRNSPTPYAAPNMGHLKAKFSDFNGGSDTNKVYKKRTAPKPPMEDHYLEQRPIPTKKGPAPQPFRPVQTDPLIKEMESFGKSKTKPDDNEEPPFNFQGMLRKTKYNRNSMKRNNDFRMSLPIDDQMNNNSVIFDSRSKSTLDVSDKVTQMRKTTLSNEKLSSPRNAGGRKTPDRNSNSVEIAPGIVLEGDVYCEDL